MKKFVYKLLSNIIVFMLLLVFVFTGVSEFLKVKNKINTSLEQQTLVMGHSHTECAYNDAFIINTSNFAASGESYFYTLQKLRFLIENVDKIDRVFLEFSNNQINVKMDDWTYGDAYMVNKAPGFMQYMSVEDHIVLGKNNFEGYFNSLSIYLRESLLRIVKQNFDYSKSLGGYLKLNRNITEKPSKLEEVKRGVSDLNIKYLKKIVALCHEHKISLAFIRTPQHIQYEYLVNEKDFQKIRYAEFNDVKFIDLNDFALESSDFADFGHLNEQGALKLSEYFNMLINNE